MQRKQNAAPTTAQVANTAEPDNGKAATDARIATRRRVFLQSGKVFDVTGKLIAEAGLRDISASGMQIILHNSMQLPDIFRVEVSHSGALVTCSAIWRRGHVYGARVVVDNTGLWEKATGNVTDRRKSPRRRVYMQSAKIFTEDGQLLGEGLVRDISQTGMRIALANLRELPLKFRVHIEHDQKVATCTLVWRRERLVGVKIL